jgi:hypothetical protein
MLTEILTFELCWCRSRYCFKGFVKTDEIVESGIVTYFFKAHFVVSELKAGV